MKHLRFAGDTNWRILSEEEDIVGRGGKESVKAAKTQIFKEKNNHAYYMHVQLNW